MSYQSYKEVFKLDTAAQRHLLQTGDAVERVWAAWALGITIGRDSVPDLTRGVDESPEAGTRRHILVMLAGYNELEVLRVFATNDPDEYVRATACHYLIQASQPDDLSTNQLIHDCILKDSSSVVRVAILKYAPAGFLDLPESELEHLLDNGDLEVRESLIDYQLASTSLDYLFPGILENQILLEPDIDLRQRLINLCIDAGGAARLLCLGQQLSSHRELEILRILIDHQYQFPWGLLKPFTVAEDIQVDDLILKLLAPEETLEAFQWLVHLLARDIGWPEPGNWAESKQAYIVQKSASDATQILITSSEQLHTIQGVNVKREDIDGAINYLIRYIKWLDDEAEFIHTEIATFDSYMLHYLDDEFDFDEEWINQARQVLQELINILIKVNNE